MPTFPTTYLPLTTTFTAPAECWDTPWMVEGPVKWFKQGGDLVSSCFPPEFPFSESHVVYSPGICPAGWTSACESPTTRGPFTQDIVTCCPRSMNCVLGDRSHAFESSFKCVSAYSVNTKAWGLKASDEWVESMYQSEIMIVTVAASTVISSSATPSATISSLAVSTTEILSKPKSTPSQTPNPWSTTTTAPHTSPNTTASTSITADPAEKPVLQKGAIAGIAIGSISVLMIIALLGYIALALHRNRQCNATSQSPSQPEHKGQPSSWAKPWRNRHRATMRAELEEVTRMEVDGAETFEIDGFEKRAKVVYEI